jgi:hypothetical protein
MAALLNRARMTTATTGTGTVTLGSAVTGYASFAEAGAVNATVYSYCIEDGDDFEIGVGTYTSSGTTFSRDTVTLSKIGGTSGTSKINLSGTAEIFITLRSADPYLVGGTDVAIADGGTGASDAATARTNLGVGTGDSPQFTAVNIGHATDTTLTRVSAGVVAIEGSNILKASDIGSTVQAYDAQLAAFAANTGVTGTITVSTSDPSGGSDGDLWLKYTA